MVAQWNVNTRAGDFPMRMDPDWDSPWRQPAVLLPNHARCENCRFYGRTFGICILETLSFHERRAKLAEDRCWEWKENHET